MIFVEPFVLAGELMQHTFMITLMGVIGASYIVTCFYRGEHDIVYRARRFDVFSLLIITLLALIWLFLDLYISFNGGNYTNYFDIHAAIVTLSSVLLLIVVWRRRSKKILIILL